MFETKSETKSNWECVSQKIKDQVPIELGRSASYSFYETPSEMLATLSYYKFAAKMIGKNKKVLDVGCNEGLGAYLIAKECGFAKGIDFDEEAIATAKTNFQDLNLEFESGNFLTTLPTEQRDAVISFSVIEHIFPENAALFLKQVAAHIVPEGMAIIGTPSLISQEFAPAIFKQGRVNIYAMERLEAEMKNHFTHVFLFSANDEVIQAGYSPLAHYFIAVGCKKKS